MLQLNVTNIARAKHKGVKYNQTIVRIGSRDTSWKNQITRSLFVPSAWEVASSRPEHGPLCSLSQPGNDDCATVEKRNIPGRFSHDRDTRALDATVIAYLTYFIRILCYSMCHNCTFCQHERWTSDFVNLNTCTAMKMFETFFSFSIDAFGKFFKFSFSLSVKMHLTFFRNFAKIVFE